MRLKHRWCPKGCREITQKIGRKPNIRMNIIVRPDVVKKSYKRYDILLDWWCPQCDYIEPVNSKDIRRISKRTKHQQSTTAREMYELKEPEIT